MTQFRVTVDQQQMRTRDFLLLEDVPVWLLSVQQRRVAPEVRERFSYIKTYLVEAVRQAFAQLTGLPAAPSSVIGEHLHRSAGGALRRGGAVYQRAVPHTHRGRGCG